MVVFALASVGSTCLTAPVLVAPGRFFYRLLFNRFLNPIPIPEQNTGGVRQFLCTLSEILVCDDSGHLAAVENLACIHFLDWRISKVRGVTLALDGVFDSVFLSQNVNTLVAASFGDFDIREPGALEQVSCPIFKVVALPLCRFSAVHSLQNQLW